MAIVDLARVDSQSNPPTNNEDVVTVLLVDDQAIVGAAVRYTLRDQPHFRFHHCTDPHEALGLAKQINPTVILQDLVMPGVDGLTLVEQYRASPVTQEVPVIVLSSTDSPAVKSEAFRRGANDYLIKPTDPVELIARLRHHAKSYLNFIRREEAYRALRETQRQFIELNAELQRLSKIDGLTGLNNRRCLDIYLETEWKRSARDKKPLALLMIDVDYFKRYNDTYGHLAGDDVLKRVAATIRETLSRPADFTARFGGEEFIGVLPNTGLTGAKHVADKVRRAVEELHIEHSASAATGYVTISIGVASMDAKRDGTLTALVEAADVALYEAKKLGRNRVFVSTRSMDRTPLMPPSSVLQPPSIYSAIKPK
jgi:two-component system chemotaxis family response regulator WspR